MGLYLSYERTGLYLLIALDCSELQSSTLKLIVTPGSAKLTESGHSVFSLLLEGVVQKLYDKKKDGVTPSLLFGRVCKSV